MSTSLRRVPTPDRLVGAIEKQRAAFRAEMAPSLACRLDRLARVRAMTDSHEVALMRAIDDDFGGRARQETALSDLFTVRAAVAQARRHLKAWMKPRRVSTAMQFFPARNELMRQPLGVVGIVAPWNYPYQLAMCPAVAAVAAGNRVMIKPSELTPQFSIVLASMVAEYFDTSEMTVIQGDVDIGRRFVGLPFDHLFFTGSTAVGRDVAQAAARNLTPVTLELGGKSPALLDASCDLADAAPRIAYGKLLNAGQTCTAPDYLLAPRDRVEAIAGAIATAMRAMVPRIHANPDFTSIIGSRHLARLQDLLDDARSKGARVLSIGDLTAVVPAGSKRFMPAVVLDATPDMLVMQQEIFGPILPIIPYDRLDDAIAFVNDRERPLALYWFGKDHAARDRVLRETISGGVTINDCIWHFAQENQPFGGVGASGHGAYHGEWGFRTFSKEKPVLHQSKWVGTHRFYPPYGAGFERLLGLLHRLL